MTVTDWEFTHSLTHSRSLTHSLTHSLKPACTHHVTTPQSSLPYIKLSTVLALPLYTCLHPPHHPTLFCIESNCSSPMCTCSVRAHAHEYWYSCTTRAAPAVDTPTIMPDWDDPRTILALRALALGVLGWLMEAARAVLWVLIFVFMLLWAYRL